MLRKLFIKPNELKMKFFDFKTFDISIVKEDPDYYL